MKNYLIKMLVIFSFLAIPVLFNSVAPFVVKIYLGLFYVLGALIIFASLWNVFLLMCGGLLLMIGSFLTLKDPSDEAFNTMVERYEIEFKKTQNRRPLNTTILTFLVGLWLLSVPFIYNTYGFTFINTFIISLSFDSLLESFYRGPGRPESTPVDIV